MSERHYCLLLEFQLVEMDIRDSAQGRVKGVVSPEVECGGIILKKWTVRRKMGRRMGRYLQLLDHHNVSYINLDHARYSPADMEGPPKRRMNTLEMAKTIKRRSKYYVPIIEWLPQYSLPLFYGDLTAGVSLACLLVPQAMSYASGLAKLTPVAGIWSTAIPSFIYGIFGTCR